MELKIYDSKNIVATEFSSYLKEMMSKKVECHIALSGGSTPKIVFDELAASFKESIDWSKVHLYWGDERCVPPTDDESNYKMTVTHLLSKVAIPAENIHRILGENDPQEEAVRYGALLQEKLTVTHGIPQFDLVILGMGDDGHTASIFPHEIDLWDNDQNCVVAIHPDSGQRRVSLTGKVINNALEVAFLVTGESKREKVKEILNQEEIAKDYPASLVQPTTGNLVWFLDKAAAADVNPTEA